MAKKYEDEEFRKITDHPNYSVSNYGRFKKGRKLIETKWDSAHEYRTICLDGKRYRAHRIVAQEWCENDDPEHKTVVDHIDTNKENNFASNLRWCTVQQNTQWAVEAGLTSYAKQGWIVAVDVKTRDGRVFKSQVDAGKALGIDPKHISGVINGTKKNISGYIFFRINEINELTAVRDENGAYGRTGKGGSFAVATVDDITMQITDDRENYIKPSELRDICIKYLTEKEYL